MRCFSHTTDSSSYTTTIPTFPFICIPVFTLSRDEVSLAQRARQPVSRRDVWGVRGFLPVDCHPLGLLTLCGKCVCIFLLDRNRVDAE